MPGPLLASLAVAAGFVVAVIGTPAGISGAFLLTPFQISVLHITAPTASASALLFNVLATPGGILRYRRTSGVDLRVVRLVALGSVPGVVLGAFLRIAVFDQPATFKRVVGVVLVALGAKVWADLIRPRGAARQSPDGVTGEPEPEREPGTEIHVPWGSPVAISVVGFLAGTLGGIYGIGGGSLVAPYLVGMAGYLVHRIAGATLAATWITSVTGVVCFTVAAALWSTGAPIAPNWWLGLGFGVGGFAGATLGAGLQRRLPERPVRALLGTIVAVLGVIYVAGG